MRLCQQLCFFIVSFFSTLTGFADTLKFNMPQGVTPLSHDIYDLHMTIFWICVVIGGLVFGAMIYIFIHHRKSIGHKAATFEENKKVELAWIIIPTIILVLMAIPATIVLIDMNDESKSEVNIMIVGHQWYWEYRYLDYGVQFESRLSTPESEIQGTGKKSKWYLLEVDNPLVVPIHKKIRFLVTSADVIHSWWVPDLGVKRDAIPGFIYEAWARIDKPGVYRGQCAELCGLRHGFMPIVVVAKTQQEFNHWIHEKSGGKVTLDKNGESTAAPETKKVTEVTPQSTEKTPAAVAITKDELIKLGEKSYAQHCAICHKADGSGTPPAFPALKGSKIVDGPAAEHIKIVLNGKSGTAMMAFDNQLSDKEIAAVVTYERTSWGNNAGVVQPEDVKKMRKP